jgi:hypothetical protein
MTARGKERRERTLRTLLLLLWANSQAEEEAEEAEAAAEGLLDAIRSRVVIADEYDELGKGDEVRPAGGLFTTKR